MAKKQPSDDVSIGKFDILATYAYAQALLNGMTDDEAKQRGMVAAIMGAQARLGIRKEHHEEFQAQKEAAEKKKSVRASRSVDPASEVDRLCPMTSGLRVPLHMLLGPHRQFQPDPVRSLALVRTARLEPDLDVQGLVAHIPREHHRHGERHLAVVDEELLVQPLDPERVRGRQHRLPDLQPLDRGHGHGEGNVTVRDRQAVYMPAGGTTTSTFTRSR